MVVALSAHLCSVCKVWARWGPWKNQEETPRTGWGKEKAGPRKQEQGFMNVNILVALLLEASSISGLNKGERFQSSDWPLCVSLCVYAIFLSHTLQTSLPHVLQRQFLWCGNFTLSTSLFLSFWWVDGRMKKPQPFFFFETLIKAMAPLYRNKYTYSTLKK